MIEQRPRRSVLTVPGSSPRFIAKAALTAADAVILDLEDSVAADQRVQARQHIIAALRDQDWSDKLRTVRVSAISTPWFYQDLISVVEGAGGWIDAIVLPKVNTASDVYMLDMLLTQIEAAHSLPHRIGIEAQIETAAGLVQAEAIASASSRLTALVFGPGDFAAAMGMPILGIGFGGENFPNYVWMAALSRMLVAARAAGVLAIDGPYGKLHDLSGLQQSALQSRMLGYDGKWAIHPDQLEPINELFSPTAAELEQARNVVAAYEASLNSGAGAVRSGGQMLDAASVAMAQRLLGRARENR